MYSAPLNQNFPQIATLITLYNPNQRRLTATTSELTIKIPTFTNFDQILKKTNPNNIIMTTMDYTHTQYIITTLQSRKQTISEKPLYTTTKQCHQIIKTTANNPTTYQITHNTHYKTTHATIQTILHNNRLNQIQFIQFNETLNHYHNTDYFQR